MTDSHGERSPLIKIEWLRLLHFLRFKLPLVCTRSKVFEAMRGLGGLFFSGTVISGSTKKGQECITG